MPVPQIDTSLPADHAPINASELRTQFQGLQNQMNVIFQNPPGIAALNMTVSDPSSPSLRRDKSACHR